MADFIWKSLLTEFLGTFTLVFVGAGAAALTYQQGLSVISTALAFGLVFIGIAYTWGSYSGAHVNPAVSFGFAVAGRMNWGLMLGYWVAQLLGGIAAAALLAYFLGTGSGVGASVGSLTYTDGWKALLLEAILTFFLVLTFLFVSKNPMLAVVSGLAIGAVIAADMFIGFPLTGGSMNPARSFGPALFSGNLGSIWIYILGPLIGALVAAFVYKLFTADFNCCDKLDECGNKVVDDCGRPIKECKRPILDKCGNPVKDCGEKRYETYIKHERKLNHLQETPLSSLAEYVESYGVSPNYLKQQFERTVDKLAPGGSINNPSELVQNVVQTNNLYPTSPNIQTPYPPSVPPGASVASVPPYSQYKPTLPGNFQSLGQNLNPTPGLQIPNLPSPPLL